MKAPAKKKSATKKKTIQPAPALMSAAAAAVTCHQSKEDKAKIKYAKKLINNPNAFNTLDSNARVCNKKERMPQSLCSDHTQCYRPSPKKTGDKLMFEMFTKKVPMNDGLAEEYLFCKNVAGKPDALKKTKMNKALMICWTLNIKNTKTREALDTNTHSVYVWVLFSLFREKGIKFNEGDFKGTGMFLSAVELDFKYRPYADMKDLLKIMIMELD